MNFHVKVTVGVGIVLGIAIAVVLMARNPEEMKIEKMLQEATKWAARGHAEKCINYVSKDFKRGAEDYDTVCNLIRSTVQPGRFTDLTLKTVDPIIEEDRARVAMVLQATVTMAGLQGTQRIHLNLVMQRETEGWRVISYDSDVDRMLR